MTAMEDFDRGTDGLDGLWWLPSEPERQVHGRLNCSLSPWQLELSGTFRPTGDPWSMQVEANELVVHGTFTQGRKISLIHAD